MEKSFSKTPKDSTLPCLIPFPKRADAGHLESLPTNAMYVEPLAPSRLGLPGLALRMALKRPFSRGENTASKVLKSTRLWVRTYLFWGEGFKRFKNPYSCWLFGCSLSSSVLTHDFHQTFRWLPDATGMYAVYVIFCR